MKCRDLRLLQPADNCFSFLLRGGSLINKWTQDNGLILLFCGPPGVGKTTLALYFLHEFYTQDASEDLKVGKHDGEVLMLSMVDSAWQIHQLCERYGFNFKSNPARLLACRFSFGETPDLSKISTALGMELSNVRLLLVDGISTIGMQPEDRNSLQNFLDQIRERKQIAIVVAEEYGITKDTFLQYAVDGVVEVSINSQTRSRNLQISKLRTLNHYLGLHTFRLNDITNHKKKGVFFFPSLDCLIGERLTHPSKRANDGCSKGKKLFVGFSSGVDGFDPIVTGRGGKAFEPQNGPFRLGEQTLLLGPSGSGKFLFGTQFLAVKEENVQSVCLSFVRRYDEIQYRMSTIAGFKGEDNIKCDCLCIDPSGFVIDELAGRVHNLLRRCEDKFKSVRLFIDGISSLKILFKTEKEFESFLISFLNLLSTFSNVAALVSYYTPRVFASYGEIDIPVAERFSTIIGFNFQEHFNMLVRGIVVLKSHFTTCDTSLKMPRLDSNGRYWVDDQAGWSRVGLLGGEREQIHEEKPFIKLFFENKSEAEVIKPYFIDFQGRYPNTHIYKMVSKHNPQPDHWSFLGYAGAGHSNTKLVELRKYVMDELRQRSAFLDVPRGTIAGLKERMAPGFLWNDSTRMNDVDSYVPFYADVGVLVYQNDALKSVDLTVESVKSNLTWEDIIDRAKKFVPPKDINNQIKHLFVIPNTADDIKNFVSFFFELSWTYGWDFPPRDLKIYDSEGLKRVLESLLSWVRSFYFDKPVEILKEMIEAGKKNNAIPNPNIGGHYHESIMSRRWFSKIHLLEEDANNRAKKENAKAFQFGIAQLPGKKQNGNEVVPRGISNLDLYAIGIIRNALAPETGWMLVSSLLESLVDVTRVKRKRGLPIRKDLFCSSLIQDNLGAPPTPPKVDEKFYETDISFYHNYKNTICDIVMPNSIDGPRFRRTCDIPKFFGLERILAQHLPSLFSFSSKSESEVKDCIIRDVVKLYEKE